MTGKLRDTGCAFWIGYRRETEPRYGVFSIKRTPHPAHRIAWAIAHGRSVPRGMAVVHTCTNKQCVSPGHLALKRLTDGLGRPRTFDWKVALRLLKAGRTQTSVAKELGVSQSTVSRVWVDYITRTSY